MCDREKDGKSSGEELRREGILMSGEVKNYILLKFSVIKWHGGFYILFKIFTYRATKGVASYEAVASGFLQALCLQCLQNILLYSLLPH